MLDSRDNLLSTFRNQLDTSAKKKLGEGRKRVDALLHKVEEGLNGTNSTCFCVNCSAATENEERILRLFSQSLKKFRYVLRFDDEITDFNVPNAEGDKADDQTEASVVIQSGFVSKKRATDVRAIKEARSSLSVTQQMRTMVEAHQKIVEEQEAAAAKKQAEQESRAAAAAAKAPPSGSKSKKVYPMEIDDKKAPLLRSNATVNDQQSGGGSRVGIVVVVIIVLLIVAIGCGYYFYCYDDETGRCSALSWLPRKSSSSSSLRTQASVTAVQIAVE